MVAILLTFYIVTTLMKSIDSCGVSTHISIANEALQSFADTGKYNVSYRDIILNNYDAFYAGSNYPDAVYSSICFDGRYHDVSEDTHWAPFLNATANYIRKTYPKPWNKATEKLIAFTFGVVSHQVADISWHSLGIDQGFLQIMGNVNFHGSFSTAHPLGDVGGDMVSIFEGDLQDISLSQTWYFPVDDLVNIYKELYGEIKINADVIISCTSILYAEWIGEKLAGADLFTIFASKSPFLVEKLHSYFLGGKSDMAAWSSIIWHDAAHLIEKGPAECDIPRNTLYLRCNPEKRLKTSYINIGGDNSLQYRRKVSLMYFKNVNSKDIKIRRTLRGVYFNIRGETGRKVQAKEERSQQTDKKSNSVEKDYWTSESLVFSTKNKYAKLGWSLVSGQLPGYGHVWITAAPWYGNPGNGQHGRVYIVSTSKNYFAVNYTDIDQAADQILDGTMENCRFGYALALVDYNADGLNDLAVSAPSQGSNFLNYTGAVYIHYGNSTTGGVNNKADAVIIGDQRYFNLGTRLLGADVNMDGFNDLVIGSKYSPMGGEQRGSVSIFLSKRRDEKKQGKYFASHGDFLLEGEQNYSWFGHDFAFQKNTSIGTVLVVSAPTYRICALKNCSYSQDDIQSVGKLYGYGWSTNGEWNLLFEVTGQTSFDQLGSSIAIGDPFGTGNDILAVSSPTSDVYGYIPLEVPSTFQQAGQVFLLNLKMLAEKHTAVLPGADYVSRFEGNLDFGKFGWHVTWQDVNNDGLSDLILGSPYQTENVYNPLGVSSKLVCGKGQGMGWQRKGKFGLHTGQTLRSHPTEKYFSGNGCGSKHRHEYAVVKELKFSDPLRQLSFDENSVKLGVNDGELSGAKWPVIYSLNKHKRWLLPDLVKNDAEQLYWHEIWESKQDSRSTKPCRKKAKREETQAHKLRVVVVERHASNNICVRKPDCIGVTSSSPSLNSSEPQRKPRKKYAHVGDLKTKVKGSSEDSVEVCYEFLSPFPKKSFPCHRQHSRLSRRWSLGEFSGSKSKKKCKGRRNKGYRNPNLEKDAGSGSNGFNDEVVKEESANHLERTCYFPLGAYIDDILKSGCDNQKKSCPPVNTNQAVLPKSPVIYGKGEAIYVEKENQAKSINNKAITEIIEPLIVDRKVKFNFLVEDIAADNLRQQFGSNYIEDDILPRKFIIKADVNETLPSTCNDMEECCVLFEVADTLSSVVEADVTVLVPNDDELPHNVVDVIESDLYSLSNVEPLTVKTVVEHATEKIISEVVRMPRNTCSKKSDKSMARFPVEFIHNVCERKPEICGIRDASRYSMKSSAGGEECHSPSNYLHNEERDELHCQICFIKDDVQLETDFTSLLRCSHRFCNDCWTMYITSCVGFGKSRITCPHFKCKTVIGGPIVWSRTNSDVYRRYTKLKREVAIDTNQQFRHCPAANCTHMAYISSLTKKKSSLAVPIICKCGQIWCFGCQKDAHWPASCEEAESFRKKCDDNESLKKTYLLPGHISSVQVKRCPFCSHPIEKNVGCQHMSCRCGNEFCWECLSPWNDHNWDKCDESRKDLEDVELAFDFGNARFNKYSKIALDNFIERSGKRLAVFRRLTRRAKQLDDITKFVSFDLETSANRRLRKYAEKRLGTFVEQIFNFKYLAHLVLENTAAALAITGTKKMLKSLDKNMRILNFIVQRLNEILSKPEVLSDEKNFEKSMLLLLQGEQLIRNIHVYTRARRHNHVH